MKKTLLFFASLFFTFFSNAQAVDTIVTQAVDSLYITVQVGDGGKVSIKDMTLPKDTILSVALDSSRTFTITPDSAYQIATLTYNGTDVKSQIVNNRYSTPPVVTNAILLVTFEEIPFLELQKLDNDSSLQVKCNRKWTAESDQTWLILSPVSGSGNDTITFIMASNPTTTPRTATLTFKVLGIKDQTMLIFQAGDTTLSVSSKMLDIGPYSGAVNSCAVYSNTFWTVTSGETWIQVSPSSGYGNDSLSFITTEDNPDFTTRQASVSVSATGTQNQTIIINQEQKPFILTPVDTVLSLACEEGSFAFTTVTSNIHWWAASDDYWLNVQPDTVYTGNNDTIRFRAYANTDPYERQAIIKILGEYDQLRLIQVIQAAKCPDPIFLPYDTLILLNSMNEYEYVVESNESWSVTPSQSWLLFNHGSGTGKDTIRFRPEVNPDDTARTAVAMIKTGSKVRTIAFRQQAKDLAVKLWNVTPGSLSELLTQTDLYYLTSLVVTGTINADDFIDLKNTSHMKLLDLSGTTVIGNAIPDFAFFDVSKWSGKGISTFIFPQSIYSIGGMAFYGCAQLTSMTIPEGVKFIGQEAFYQCTGLTSLSLPKSLVSIGASAFYACYKVVGSLTIPENVVQIGKEAFYVCRRITEINCMSLIPPILGSNCFKSTPISAVYVQASAVEAYKMDQIWSSFNIQTFQEKQINSAESVTENKINVYTSQSEIIVDGTPEGEIVNIYTLIGVKLATVQSQGTRIYIPVRKGSIYLVKTASKMFKVAL